MRIAPLHDQEHALNDTNDTAAERSTRTRGASVRLSDDAVAVAAELTEKSGPRFALEVARAVIAERSGGAG